MKVLIEILILAGIAVWLFFAVKNRKKGKCSGDCAHCDAVCQKER